MATRNQDVELRIRATDYSKKTTDQVVDSLKALTVAQEAQIDSAKKGTASAKQLEDGYTKLESAARALISQQAIAKTFEAQNVALLDSKTKLEAARKAQTDFTNGLDAGATKTKAQERELTALARAVSGAEKAFARAQDRVTATGERLAKFGIDSANIAGAQAKIAQGVIEANAALLKQEQAIIGLNSAQAAHQAKLAAQSQAEKQRAVDVAFTNAQRVLGEQAVIEARNKQIAAQQRQAAETERELNIDRIFLQAQAAITAELLRQTQARHAQTQAIQAAAAAADAAARSAAVAARGRAPVAAVPSLAGRIADIADPAAAAVRTTAGLEASIASLETRVLGITGPVRGYRQALNEATEAQRALQAIAGQVDAYNRQVAAVRAARAEYTTARTAVAGLVAELRSGAVGDDITTRLARAQGTLRQSAQSLGDLSTAARAAREALRLAGIDTSNLSQAEQNLIAQATRAGAAVNGLTEAYRRNGAAAETAGRTTDSWFGGGRTTLSWFQRLRGEVLGLAAAYVGLNASISLGNDVLEVYNKTQALQSRLLVANAGDAKASASDYKFLTDASRKYSFVLLDIGNAFAKFNIAAKASGLTTQQARFVFEQLSIGAKSARLSTDEFAGVLLSFQQIVSKGKVSTEELNQLGERLPGAFTIAAKSLKLTNAEFSKQLELGQRGVQDVVAIARGIGETYGAIATGAQTLNGAQADFKNNVKDFKTAIAAAGFAEAYQNFLNKLSALIGGESGDKLAKGLSDGFTAVLNVILVLVENIDTLKLVLQSLLALKIVQWLFGLKAAVIALKVEFALLNTQVIAFEAATLALIARGAALTGFFTLSAGAAAFLTRAVGVAGIALRGLLRLIPGIGLALIAFEVGSLIYDKWFGTDAGIEKAAKEKADLAKAALKTNLIEDPGTADTSFALLEKSIAGRTSALEKLEQERLDILKAGAKKDLKSRLDLINQGFDADRKAAVDTYSDKVALELRLADIQSISHAAQINERLRFHNEQASLDEAAGKRREGLLLDATTKIAAIEAEIAKRAAEADPSSTFDDVRKTRIEAIVHSYDELFKLLEKIKSNTPAQAAQVELLKVRYQLILGIRKVEEENNVARENSTKLEKTYNDLLSVQKSRQDELNALRESGAISQEEFLAKTNALIAELNPAIEDAGKKALDFVKQVEGLIDPVKYADFVSKITASLAKVNTEAQTSAVNLGGAQKQLNDQLAARSRLYDEINLKQKLGLISSEQAAEATNATTAAFKTSIETSAAKLLGFVTTARTVGGANVAALDEVQSKTEGIVLASQNASAAFSSLDGVIAGSIATNAVTAFESLAVSIGKVATGQQSLAEGFRDAAAAAGQFFATLLRDIGLAIVKQLILNAVVKGLGASSPVGAAAVAAGGQIAAGARHSGGVVGQSTSSFSRSVDSSIFAGAQKLHNGGFPGLRPDEVPTILQKNEEVLTRDDPRHALNGGGGGSNAGAGNRFVLVDDRSKVAEAMASSEGEQVTLVHLRRNIATIKQWVK